MITSRRIVHPTSLPRLHLKVFVLTKPCLKISLFKERIKKKKNNTKYHYNRFPYTEFLWTQSN